MNDSQNSKKKKEFSKLLLIQESVLIWITTLSLIVLAYICILHGYLGSLPWLTAMVGLPWSTYGVSQCFYYNKSKAECTKNGITYETVMANTLYEQNNLLYNTGTDFYNNNNQNSSDSFFNFDDEEDMSGTDVSLF